MYNLISATPAARALACSREWVRRGLGPLLQGVVIAGRRVYLAERVAGLAASRERDRQTSPIVHTP